VRLDDDAFQQSDDGHSGVLRVENLLEFDRFQFVGPGNVRTHLTFETTYTKHGNPTILLPRPDPPGPFNGDPTNIFNWAGEMWDASARGTFFARYDDGSFSVRGTMDSAVAVEGAQGHMGDERNGVFAHQPHEGNGD
jgi:hypothetical protein